MVWYGMVWYGMVWYGMAGVERLASLHKGLWDPGVRVEEQNFQKNFLNVFIFFTTGGG